MKEIVPMNWTRAIITGIIIWIIILIEVSILRIRVGWGNNFYGFTHFILLAVILIIISLIYFKGEGVKTGVLGGLLTGIIFIIVSIVLDALISVPIFGENYSFFLNPYLWVGYLETIIIVWVIGAASE